MTMPSVHRARIFAGWRFVFPKLPKITKSFATVGGVFLTFLPTIKDNKSIWQTAGDALIAQLK
jgi:hypothetical protein